MKQITPSLSLLPLGFVNAYLLEDHEGLTLIDTGMPGGADKIVTALEKAGKDPQKIKRILLTHAHTDHAGSAAALASRWSVPVWAHAEEASLLARGLPGEKPLITSPGLMNHLIAAMVAGKARSHIEPVETARKLEDGEVLPIAGGLRVLLTPGHSPGHLAFLLVKEKVLVAGDICAHMNGLSWSMGYEDRAQGLRSILKAAEEDFDTAVFGHGGPLRAQANQRLKARFTR